MFLAPVHIYDITVSDDESLESIIQKIKDTGKYDAGIEDGSQ